MIKAFRKIRQKILPENKFSQYLLYAVGEIVLVVVGILIALEIDNWNEDRIDAKKEIKALIDLRAEFELNKSRIEEKQNKRIFISKELDRYTNFVIKGKADYQLFHDFHIQAYFIGFTNPSNGVIDALISSGGLSLITNDSLKYLIADWKDQLGNLLENETIMWTISQDYESHYRKIILSPRANWHDDSKKRKEFSFKKLSLNIEYRNRLRSFNGTLPQVIQACNEVLHSIDQAIKLIDNELLKKQKQ